MTSSISADLRHKMFRELRGIIKLFSSITIVLGQFCVVVRFTHWEVRRGFPKKSTVSVSLLSAIKELGVRSYQEIIKITFISIAERMWVNVVFYIIKESISF